MARIASAIKRKIEAKSKSCAVFVRLENTGKAGIAPGPFHPFASPAFLIILSSSSLSQSKTPVAAARVLAPDVKC